LESAPIETIRERAEVSNGSFFHHFPTRAALVGELYLDGLRRYHAHIEEAIAPDPPAAAGVAAAIHAHLDWVVLQRSLSRLLEERVSLSEADQRRRTKENERFATVLDRWRRSLIESHQIVPMDNDLFVALIVGPARIISRNWLLGHRQVPPDSYSDDLVAAAIRALGVVRRE
jgi:AcrR family transcriptional regulator